MGAFGLLGLPECAYLCGSTRAVGSRRRRSPIRLADGVPSRDVGAEAGIRYGVPDNAPLGAVAADSQRARPAVAARVLNPDG
jgi:hypothetical protein